MRSPPVSARSPARPDPSRLLPTPHRTPPARPPPLTPPRLPALLTFYSAPAQAAKAKAEREAAEKARRPPLGRCVQRSPASHAHCHTHAAGLFPRSILDTRTSPQVSALSPVLDPTPDHRCDPGAISPGLLSISRDLAEIGLLRRCIISCDLLQISRIAVPQGRLHLVGLLSISPIPAISCDLRQSPPGP